MEIRLGVPPFVGIREEAFSVGHKSYSGLVYRGISDPTRRSTEFVVKIGSSSN